jgi:hypothetical protein
VVWNCGVIVVLLRYPELPEDILRGAGKGFLPAPHPDIDF